MPMASGKTSYSKPGIFDYGVDYYKGQQEASKYGADPTAGLNQYSNYANDTRNPGLAAQMDAAGFYRAQAMGQTPSLAEMQMQQGLGQAQRNTMQAATMGRGGNLAGMQQSAISAGAGMQAGTNQAGALLRAQEQQAAMAGLAGLGGQMYGQGLQYDQLAAQSQANNAAQMLDWYQARRGMDMQQSQMNWDRKMGLMNFGWGVAKDTAGMISGGMGGGLMSDERAKQGIVPTQGGISQAAAMATPVAYQYRPGMGDGPGPRAGFLAQDLERTPLGPALVRDTPQGKMVDTGQASMAALAGVAELRRDLDAMRGHEGQAVGVPATYRRPAEYGNVDLYAQPKVRNPDGSISTVHSASYNLDGQEVLLPSVTPDGRHLQTDDEIINEYRKTGRHLGKFSDVPSAVGFAKKLHNDYEAGVYEQRPMAQASLGRLNSSHSSARGGMAAASNAASMARASLERQRKPGSDDGSTISQQKTRNA